MRIARELPYRVETVETAWIPTRDGTRLAARLWIPEGAADQPVPAILEYIPYRRRDRTRARDQLHHTWFAGHGYACVRVDLRGSGDSEGVLEDEYLEVELTDGEDVLRWLAEQPWCNGRVGMIGISWGGFNGLQLAARQPPELGAVVSICSTDDRYTDDVHYMGGCLLGDNLSWASTMFAYNSLPPDPQVVGEAWRGLWRRRLEGSGLWLARWLEHQRRDDYWRHGSICEDYSAMQTPVMLVSGWADGYSNAVFRMLARLRCPRLGLVGPWSHLYPHMGVPGPAIGFLQECLRFWDHWLKGEETGIMDEPMLRAWMLESMPPTTSYETRPGRWVGEERWPSPAVDLVRWVLEGMETCERPSGPERKPLTIDSPLSVGLFAGKWCSYSATPDLPHDQRQEDGGALVFETAHLRDPVEILGAPVVELDVAADRPVAQVGVRLSDVRPDGAATRVTYGVLNLTHRDGHSEPTPLQPGHRYRVRVQMNEIGQVFPAGHRIRVSVSSSYWPLAWPAPRRATLTVRPAESVLVLPVRRPRAELDGRIGFEPPEAAPPLEVRTLEPPRSNWIVTRDLAADLSTLEVTKDQGLRDIPEIDMEIGGNTVERYSFHHDRYDTLRGEVRTERRMQRGEWKVLTRTRTILTATSEYFRVDADLDAFEGERRFFSNTWGMRIRRDQM